MARPIDGDALFCKFWNLADPYVKQEKVYPSQVWNQAATMAREAPTLTPPNEPLTQADLDSMDYDKVWIDYEDGTGEWALVCGGRIYSIDTLEGAGLDFNDYMRGERIENCGYIVYRRPPEEGETAC